MTSRERKIRRIAAVQAKMHRLAEWQLMECASKEQELQDRQRRILESFNHESGVSSLAAQSAGQNLRTASVQQGVLAKTKERLASHALTEARKLKQVLRMASAVARRAFRAQEQRVLEEVSERTARRPIEGIHPDESHSDR